MNKSNQNEVFVEDLDEIFNCDECEYRECFDCPKAIGQEVTVHLF